MRCAYPLLLDLTDRAVVIIGGGAVAARKAAGVIAAGAKHVIVVAPKLTSPLPDGVEHLAQTYEPSHLTAAELVFAATDQPEVNAKIVRDARAAGILANRADTDEADPGDFIVPATLRSGGLTIAVSASGSPALAARVRDLLGEALSKKWIILSEVTNKVRQSVIQQIQDAQARRAVLRDLASDEAADQVSAGGEEALLRWLTERHPQLKHS